MTCLQEEIVLDIIIWLQLERSQAIQVGGDNLLQPKSHSVQASSSWRWIEIELHLHSCTQLKFILFRNFQSQLFLPSYLEVTLHQ